MASALSGITGARTAECHTLDAEELARGVPSANAPGARQTPRAAASPEFPDNLDRLSRPPDLCARPDLPCACKDGRYEFVIALTVLTLPLHVLTGVPFAHSR